MINRTCLLAAVSAIVFVLVAKTAPAQNGPPDRQYPISAGQPNDGGPERSLNRVPAQQIDPALSPRTDAARGPAAPQNPPPPPFTLSPQEQADLDKTLDTWEQKNGQIKTFKCNFDRKQYDPVFFPKQPGQPEEPRQTSKGEIKYVAPDKGLLRETEGETWSLNPTTRKLEKKTLDALEHWTCDGKTLYKVDYQQKTIEEIPIPPELQGKGITQGPLPFVFGAKAADLKARYYIRPDPTAPKEDKSHAWLEIRPKFIRDAQNFSEVDLILRTKDMFPEAIQIHGTNGTDRDVYLLSPQGFNPIPSIGNEFSPSPFGFKHVKNNPPPAPASGQAQRFVPDASRR